METMTITVSCKSEVLRASCLLPTFGTATMVEFAGRLLAEIQSQADEVLNGPVWQDNDVCLVRFGSKSGRLYTYMRRDGSWGGTHSWSAFDDARMSAMHRAGRAQLVIRDSRVLVAPTPQELQP